MLAMAHRSPQSMPQRVIVGLGETGLSVARHLHRLGQPFAVVDSRAEPPGRAELAALDSAVPVHFGDLDTPWLTAAGEIVLSPGLSPELPQIRAAREAGVEVVGDIELFARAADAPVIAITGSNGKSTVTALVGEMARAAGIEVGVGGNIGTPALDLLTRPHELFVLELSSFQLETTRSLAPRAAVILNISADHLDRHGNLDRYAAAKARIYAQAACRIANRDDARVRALAGPDAISFGLDRPPREADYGLIEEADGLWLARGRQRLLAADALQVAGRHNLANVLAALALAEQAGIPQPAALEAARRFTGLPHRCRLVAEHGGVRWYNDSKGTNVGATVAAIEGLGRPLVLLAGGLGKGQDFVPLASALRGRARAVLLFGEAAGEMAEAIGDAAPVERVGDLRQAVVRAAELARPGEAVLLSPACASFDQFSGFAARGEAFEQAVREVIHG